jgi:hypothetical protein
MGKLVDSKPIQNATQVGTIDWEYHEGTIELEPPDLSQLKERDMVLVKSIVMDVNEEGIVIDEPIILNKDIVAILPKQEEQAKERKALAKGKKREQEKAQREAETKKQRKVAEKEQKRRSRRYEIEEVKRKLAAGSARAEGMPELIRDVFNPKISNKDAVKRYNQRGHTKNLKKVDRAKGGAVRVTIGKESFRIPRVQVDALLEYQADIEKGEEIELGLFQNKLSEGVKVEGACAPGIDHSSRARPGCKLFRIDAYPVHLAKTVNVKIDEPGGDDEALGVDAFCRFSVV